MTPPPVTPHKLSGLSVPFWWPMAAATRMVEQGLDLYATNLEFIAEEQKIHQELRPQLATASRVMLDLRTMLLRDYSAPAATGVPTIVDTPYAGHTAMIADYHKGQSLIETLLANGLDRVFLTDWKSATADMKDLGIDEYLAEVNVRAGRHGRRADAGQDHAAGLEGHASIAALHPAAYRPLRAHRGPCLLCKEETFESWYENPIDLPGRLYLQAIVQLFKENRLAKGTFVGLGRRLELKSITCPVYLLAGDSDDITTQEQVLDAEKYLGTPNSLIEKAVVPGGHVGLFMGSQTLRDTWPVIARWIAGH